jgi:hypothetical protein
MHETVSVDHQTDVVLARPRLEEDQIPGLGATSKRPRRCLLLRRDTWDRQSRFTVRNLRQTTTVERSMWRGPAINVRSADLLQSSRHNIGALRFEPTEIEELPVDLNRASRLTCAPGQQNAQNQRTGTVQ